MLPTQTKVFTSLLWTFSALWHLLLPQVQNWRTLQPILIIYTKVMRILLVDLSHVFCSRNTNSVETENCFICTRSPLRWFPSRHIHIVRSVQPTTKICEGFLSMFAQPGFSRGFPSRFPLRNSPSLLLVDDFFRNGGAMRSFFRGFHRTFHDSSTK